MCQIWSDLHVAATAMRGVSLDKVVISTMALSWFRWVTIGLGWLLATYFVSGLTGSLKSN